MLAFGRDFPGCASACLLLYWCYSPGRPERGETHAGEGLEYRSGPLGLPAEDFFFLFQQLGPSLGLWRAAEIAALREARFDPPVLDLGAGDGLVTACVLPQVEYALDPDRAALEKAAALGVYRRLLPERVEETGLPPGCLGAILSNSVLEHVERLDDALAAAARLLRPGGRLVFTAPTEAFACWLALPGPAYAARRNRHFEHLNLLSAEEWACRLERAGLRVEYARAYLRRGWVRAWDALDLLQGVHLGANGRRVRLFGYLWKRLPPAAL